MTRADELAHLNTMGAMAGLRVEEDGDGFIVRSHAPPLKVPTLTRAAFMVGALVAVSAELEAAAAVAAARHGLSHGANRAQRRMQMRREAGK